MLAERLAALGLSSAEIVTIDSLTAQKRLVEAGFGLGLLPSSGVEEELRVGTLRALPVGAMRLEVPVVLVHRRRGHLRPSPTRPPFQTRRLRGRGRRGPSARITSAAISLPRSFMTFVAVFARAMAGQPK